MSPAEAGVEGPGLQFRKDPSRNGTIPNGSLPGPDDRILVTGAAGFIGSRVVGSLLDRGFRNLVCFARPSSDLRRLESIVDRRRSAGCAEVMTGNLLCRRECEAACKDAAVIYHLAAGTGEKSFPDAYMNSVVTTRNLLDATLRFAKLRRFVLVSSFSVYSNRKRQKGRLLDESCPVEDRPHLRGEAYCFAKVEQEKIVTEYGRKYGIPVVVLRPGSVYGEGKDDIAGRVGIDTFGLFLHLGGSNPIPFTYVENCADAIALAGLVEGIAGEIFNIVDDGLVTSRKFLRLYKKNVRTFRSLYVPHLLSYALCLLWERYSGWSDGQLPPSFNGRRWHADWKKTRYSNQKLKIRLGWAPQVTTSDGLQRYFRSALENPRHA